MSLADSESTLGSPPNWCPWKTSKGRHSGGILTRSSNNLNYLLSKCKRSGSTLWCPQMSDLHTLSLRLANHPVEETHFGRLFLWPHSFGHYLDFMTVGEGWDVDTEILLQQSGKMSSLLLMLHQCANPSRAPPSHHLWMTSQDDWILLLEAAFLPIVPLYSGREPLPWIWRRWFSSHLLLTRLQTAPVHAESHALIKPTESHHPQKLRFPKQIPCSPQLYLEILYMKIKVGSETKHSLNMQRCRHRIPGIPSPESKVRQGSNLLSITLDENFNMHSYPQHYPWRLDQILFNIHALSSCS